MAIIGHTLVSAFHYVSNCFCPETETDEPNERTRILYDSLPDVNYWSYNWNRSPTIIPEINSGNDGTNRKVTQYVNQMVDIHVMDGPSISPREFRHRTQYYCERIARINRPLLLMSTYLASISTKDRKSDDKEWKLGTMDTMDTKDIELITYFSQKTSDCVHQGFKYDCKDPIVVPFDP